MSNPTTLQIVQDDIDSGLFFLNREASNTVINVGTIWVYDDAVLITIEEDGVKTETTYTISTPKAPKAPKAPRRLKESTISSYCDEALRRHLARFLRNAFTSDTAPYHVDGLNIYKRVKGVYVWHCSTDDNKYGVETVLRDVYSKVK